MKITRHPLQWPIGWKRTPPGRREPGRFAKKGEARSPGGWRPTKDVTVAEACQRLLLELDRMGIREHEVVISTNLQLRLDGLPRSDQRMPDDPGAAVYWREPVGPSQQRCMAIDRYTKVEQNIAALAATIEAMRAIERHGGAVILDRAFQGFTALPAPIVAGMKRPWRQVLQYGEGKADSKIIQECFRLLAMEHHPDRGGDPAKMAELNAARDEAMKELGDG